MSKCGMAVLLLSAVAEVLAAGPPSRVKVDPGRQFQTIDGFGLNYAGPYFREDQRAMLDMLIGDLGATIFRVVPYQVYSDWEATNDNNDAGVMDWEYYDDRYSSPNFETSWAALRYLDSRGVRTVVALMGPAPEWMLDDAASRPKHRVCTDIFASDVKRRPLVHLNPAMYDEFAEEVVSMAVYARNKALVNLKYFSPFNETDCYPPEGPRIDPEEVAKVLGVIARRMKKEGLGDVKLTVADQAIITNNYVEPILKDADLMKQVGVFTFHTYAEDSVGPQVARVRGSRYPDTPVWLTEYGSQGDTDRSPEADWKLFSLAANRRALTALNQGASALFYFNAVDGFEECSGRLEHFGLFTSAGHVYTPKKRYYATKQLYHFVPPGSRRIEAASDTPALLTSAFRAPDASLIVVGVKEGGASAIEIAVPGGSAAPRSWDVYQTTRELNCQKTGTVTVSDGVVRLDLPDQTVFTLVGRI